MKRNSLYLYLSIVFSLLFVAVCILALFPIADGILQSIRYKTPDALGIGIGFMILMSLGLPALLMAIFMYNKYKRGLGSSPDSKKGSDPFFRR